jgi:hypothetical protein
MVDASDMFIRAVSLMGRAGIYAEAGRACKMEVKMLGTRSKFDRSGRRMVGIIEMIK